MVASIPPPPSRMTRNTNAIGLASGAGAVVPASAGASGTGAGATSAGCTATDGFSPPHPASKPTNTRHELRMRFSFGNSGGDTQEEHDERDHQKPQQQSHLVAGDKSRKARFHETELGGLRLD